MRKAKSKGVGKGEGMSQRGTQMEEGEMKMVWVDCGIQASCADSLPFSGWDTRRAPAQKEALLKPAGVNKSPDFMSHLLSLLKALLNHNQITVNCQFLLEQKNPVASLLTTLFTGDSFTMYG